MHPDAVETSAQPEFKPEEGLILRGVAALYPFVERFGLALNPEDLELMVYEVLKHTRDYRGDATREEYEEIDRDVRETIESEIERQPQRFVFPDAPDADTN